MAYLRNPLISLFALILAQLAQANSNDAGATGQPLAVNNTPITLNQSSAAAIGPQNLEYSESGIATSAINFTLQSIPAHGSLRDGNGNILAIGSQFSQQQIDSSGLYYGQDGSPTSSDQFSFTVSDGTTTLPPATFQINIVPTNPLPVITTPQALQVIRGGVSAFSSSVLNVTEANADPSSLNYTLQVLPLYGVIGKNQIALPKGGTFTQADINAGLVTYQNNESNNPSDFFCFTVTDSHGATLPIQTEQINVNLATILHLVFTTQPTNTVAGTNIPSFQVTIEDQLGNVASSDLDMIQVAVSSGPGTFAANSTTSIPLQAGIANFSQLVLDTAGAYTIKASGLTNAEIQPATSSSFNISTGPLTTLAIAGPSSIVGGTCVPYLLSSQDSFGNAVPVSIDSTVSLSGAGSGAFYSDSLCATSAASTTIVSGSSSVTVYFKDFSTDSLSLTAVVAGLSGATLSVSVTGVATNLAFSTQPSRTGQIGRPLAVQPVVQIQDASGHPIPSASANVTLAAYSDSGCTQPTAVTVIAGTNPVATSSGTASFSGVIYSGAGTIYLRASASGFTSICSSAVAISDSLKSVAVAGSSVCALASSGSVYCWGSSYEGELGNNDLSNTIYPPSKVLSGGQGGGQFLTNITALVGSVGNFYCALSSTQNVYCWGVNGAAPGNYYGSLGNGTLTNSALPVEVLGVAGTGYLSNITSLVASYSHTCALSSDGTVHCWGENAQGQLGNNSTTETTSPVTVTSTNGTGTLSNITALSAGQYHSCAISSGNVFCWGYNGDGELGNGSSVYSSNVPVEVSGVGGLGHLSNIVSISSGAMHTCAVSSSGNVYCWGGNYYGELGNNSTTQSNTPVEVLAADTGTGTYLSGIASVTAGYNHNCALSSSGNVYCWGSDSSGALGNGVSGPNVLSPVEVQAGGQYGASAPYLSNVSQIAAGSGATCVVPMAANTVYCWGDAEFGVAGYPSNGSPSVPEPVSFAQSAPLSLEFVMPPSNGLPGSSIPVVQVAVVGLFGVPTPSYQNTIQVSVASGPGNLTSSSDSLTTPTEGLASFPHLAFTAPGTYTLQATAIGDTSTSPATSASFSISVGPISNLGVVGPSTVSVGVCGAYTFQSQDSAGNLVNEPSNTAIALSGVGSGSFYADSNCSTPETAATIQAGSNSIGVYFRDSSSETLNIIGALASGASTTFTVSIGGNPSKLVFSTEPSGSAQVNASLFKQPVVSVEDANGNVTTTNAAVTLTAYSDSACSQAAAGALIATQNPISASLGIASFAGIGLGTAGTFYLGASSPGLASACSSAILNTGVKSLSDACVVSSSGNIYCWGGNYYGSLGNGSTTNEYTPVEVLDGSSPLGNITSVSTSGLSACALSSAGNVYCWGYDGYGELGYGFSSNNAFSEPSSPVVSGAQGGGTQLSNISAISQGLDHTCALSTAGTVFCWGSNGLGQLGNNSNASQAYSPVQVTGVGGSGVLSNLVAISAGGEQTCALSSVGNVYCWGNNYNGNLGNGLTSNYMLSPVEVLAGEQGGTYLSNIISISTGPDSTCAVSTFGNVYCWGYNQQGSIGNNTKNQQNLPVQVVGVGGTGTLSGIVSVTSNDTTCALSSSGHVYCWGLNMLNAPGNTNYYSTAPVEIPGGDQGGSYLSNVVSVSSTNGQGVCALTSDSNGTVYCWGYYPGNGNSGFVAAPAAATPPSGGW